MRDEAIAALLVIALLAGAGGGYLLGIPNERTTTTTRATTIFSTMTVTSVYQDEGALLQLQVRLNASTIGSGGAVFAAIGLVNPFGSNLSVIPPDPANPTITNWNGFNYICGGGTFSTMVGYALFAGHYDANNLSSAGNPLRLAPPVAIPCVIFQPPALMIFLPYSNVTWDYNGPSPRSPTKAPAVINAATRVSYVNSQGGTECGGGNSLFGYWNESPGISCDTATTSSALFHFFSAGQYTLAVEAAWGQQTFAYFMVT